MKSEEQHRFSPQFRKTCDPGGYVRTTGLGYTMLLVIAAIVAAAAAASYPSWDGSGFPVASLVIYVAGMVFVAMPLCVLYELSLQAHTARLQDASASAFD